MNPKFYPVMTLYSREVKRFLKVSVQTVFAPIVSSSLYLLIFGVSLGASIQLENNTSYLAFLIPGLVMMSVLNNAFQNTSSSIVTGRFNGDLEDWKIAPLRESEILTALALGGLSRGLLVGLVTFLTGEVFYYVMNDQFLTVAHPLWLLLFLCIGGLSFAFFGVAIAFIANTFDQLSGINSFILLPLIYLGGVFFSIKSLHPVWQNISLMNPLLYYINGVRFGILGFSDVPLERAVIVSILSCLFFYFLAYRALKKGNYARW